MLLFVLQGLIKQVHEVVVALRPLLEGLRKWSRARSRRRGRERR
ncbi:hypothetical protein ACFWAR_07545 [Streptomyces sp. NPDC059917]